MDTGIGTRNLYSACRVAGDFTSFRTGGTGFVVRLADQRLALVTNRHNVDYGWAVPAYGGSVLTRVDLEVWANNATRQQLSLTPQAVRVHSDPTVDIAGVVLDSTTIIAASPPTGVIEFFLDWDYVHDAHQQYGQLVEAGELVMFPGYPEWFDKSAGRPIMRTGAIVSDPQFDYRNRAGPPTPVDGNQQIAFEAFSFSGNSGSPVFVAQRGFNAGEGIIYEGPPYHPAFLIGINAGHLSVTPPQSQPQQAGPQPPPQHAGLSRMYKTSAIIELLLTL